MEGCLPNFTPCRFPEVPSLYQLLSYCMSTAGSTSILAEHSVAFFTLSGPMGAHYQILPLWAQAYPAGEFALLLGARSLVLRTSGISRSHPAKTPLSPQKRVLNSHFSVDNDQVPYYFTGILPSESFRSSLMLFTTSQNVLMKSFLVLRAINKYPPRC